MKDNFIRKPVAVVLMFLLAVLAAAGCLHSGDQPHDQAQVEVLDAGGGGVSAVNSLLTVKLSKRLPSFWLKVALQVRNGFLAVVGPSGAGKTTLLQCLSGLQQPEEGEIVLKGRVLYSSIGRVNLPPRLRRVGYVFQDYALFPHLTVEQNAAYGMKKRRNGLEVQEMLEMLQISHLARRYPGQISGGEQQRTALARALLAGPELLLLDEPLSALDYETRLKLRGELKTLQRRWGIPFILVTHDLEEAAALGDRVVRLDMGQVVAVEARG